MQGAWLGAAHFNAMADLRMSKPRHLPCSPFEAPEPAQ